MKIIDIIAEARRNPDHPAQQRKDTIEHLLEYAKSETRYYASFTSLPKVGLNPESLHSTPLGIYCYPLFSLIEELEEENNIDQIFPYASDRKFIYVLEEKPDTPLTEVSDYDDDDWEKDKEKLKDLFDISENEIEDIIAKIKLPIKKLWKITRHYASYSEKSHVTWNKLLLDLGYSGFVDSDGLGIIHVNEPTQAFFLSTKFYKVKDKLLNKYGTHDHHYYDKMKLIDDRRKKIIKLYNRAETTEDKLAIIDNYFDDELIRHMDNILTDEEKYKLISEYVRHVYTVPDRVLKKLIKNDDPMLIKNGIAKLSTKQKQYIINIHPQWFETFNIYDVKKWLHTGEVKLNDNAKKNLAETKYIDPQRKLFLISLEELLQYDVPVRGNYIGYWINNIEEINKFTDKEFKNIHPNVMKHLISLVSEDKYSDSSKEFLRKVKSVNG